MNYAQIRTCDIANGDGVRVSLFVSGCTHHCPGCFNPEQWDFAAGKPFDAAAQALVLDALAPAHIAGLTLLGGDPMEPGNQRALLPLLRKVRERLPGKTVWCYTGFRLEDELWQEGSHPRCEVTDEMLSLMDVLVDGRFVEAEKDIRLKFRGSRNQRLLDLPRTLAAGEAVLLDVEERVGS